jgi:hypothetical protein
MKKFVVLASLAAVIVATPAFAVQKIKDVPPAKPDDGPRACLLSDVKPTAVACSGFFEKNLLSNNKGDITAQQEALSAIGFKWDGDFKAVSKIDSLNGSTIVDFSTGSNPVKTLYGDTWIGVHFGGGAGLGGNATGFWKIDAGLEGLNSILLTITKGSSGAVLYGTQSAPTGGGGGGGGGFGGGIGPDVGVIPEPASWMMLIAGFGLVGAAKRRRVAAIA